MLESEIYLQSDGANRLQPRGLLVFFITGNPGLIEYYRDFLTYLHRELRQQQPPTDLHIYGASLPGFEVDSSSIDPTTSHVRSRKSGPPYSLRDEIASVQSRLSSMVEHLTSRYDKPLSVVLIGHSVGAYIMMDLYNSMLAAPNPQPNIHLAALIGLFPTIADIAQSPSGRKFAKILQLSPVPLVVSWVAWTIFNWMPISIVSNLLQTLLRMPSSGAMTTATFLKSPHGVRQALFMAADEMREIGTDNWSDLLWGAEASPEPAELADGNNASSKPKMFFYWGVDDHWVDNKSRDELIQKRGRLVAHDDAKPKMEMDEKKIPHAFCFNHSEVVADKVVEYIKEATRAL